MLSDLFLGEHFQVHTPVAPVVICEVSANHLGSLDNCLKLVSAVASAGAGAVKFQHFKPESLTMKSDHPDFRVSSGTLWDGAQLFDVYSEGALPWEWTERLSIECSNLGIEWFSSAFDFESADFLETCGVSAFKVASFELVDTPLIHHLAAKGRPIFLSTGMATLGEIDEAVVAARSAGCREIALLRCNSGYPAVLSEMDLASIPTMAKLWSLPIGLSDHTLTSTTSAVAVALGATFVEKHVTLDRSLGGPDAAFSLEPSEVAELVRVVGDAFEIRGSVRFGPSKHELTSLPYRRSLRVSQDLEAGDVLSLKNVRSVRPSGGLHPRELTRLLGSRVRRDLRVGDPLRWEDVDIGDAQ